MVNRGKSGIRCARFTLLARLAAGAGNPIGNSWARRKLMDQSTLDSLGGYGQLAISYSLDFIGAIILLVGGWLVVGTPRGCPPALALGCML